MPTLATSFLDANLQALGRRNADLADKLRGACTPVDLVFADSADGVATATLDGRQLCSKVHPLQEARRLVDDVDLVEHAVVIVLGFGLGWHVQRLADRSDKSALIVVYESDFALLRAVFEQIDHSRWLREALVLFVTDAEDRGDLGVKLQGAESILGQGVHILEHPASRARLGAGAAKFTQAFNEHVAAARTTLATTLMRSVDTARNLLLNIDHYCAGARLHDLADIAKGLPAVIVSAGPSLHRNMHLLKQEHMRERCVIIAVQTALRPLLDAGIRPHFVTALDYHEISRRFYEDLDADALRDVTLVADPKVHPVVLDIYPGPVRCCANGFLDKALGSCARPMGDLPAGATVAHLAMYLARFLGCDPVAMIGQDLGFPDGLYYAPGAVIHDTWAPELNPFNTIAMMEWQRIARHRLHLRKTRDVHGRSIFTDAQMHTYLQQFERDFAEYARKGLTTIDATEGGVSKQHTRAMPLHEFLDQHATRPLPDIALPERSLDEARLRKCSERLLTLRREIERLRGVSRDTESVLRRMFDDQRDQRNMARHFERIETNRREVDRLFDAFELLNNLNQMGVFRRMKADRQLHLAKALDPMTAQRRQLERDLENVRWLAETADEMLTQLDASCRVLKSGDVAQRSEVPEQGFVAKLPSTLAASRIAALIPIDPRRNGLGIERSLTDTFRAKTILQATLERLGQSQSLESIILIVPRAFDVESLIDRSRIDLRVEVEQCDGESPFGPEHEAITVARLFADTCWRGGIAGMSVYDEVLCPQVMSMIMKKRSLTAAVLAAPDWPLINVTAQGGCDALVRRHLEHPEQHNLVFTQSPPGLCGCLISAKLMNELSQRNRLSTIGGLLVYQPHAPQHDPIARDACVQVVHAVRRSLARATADTPRWKEAIARVDIDAPIAQLMSDLDGACGLAHAQTPQHIILELTTARTSHGIFAQSLNAGAASRDPMSVALAERILIQIAEAANDDVVLTLHGAGDPLLHPDFDQIIRRAKASSIRAVHVRTELLCDPPHTPHPPTPTIDRLLASGVDVVSVDLNADRAATYQAMMGVDRFRDVLMNLEYLIEHRRRLTSQTGTAAIALPWVLPHLQRRAETYEDIDPFFDRWQHMLGTAVIEDPPPDDPKPIGLTPAVTPPRVLHRESLRRMTILCDGSVPQRDGDFRGDGCVGNVGEQSMLELWQSLRSKRHALTKECA